MYDKRFYIADRVGNRKVYFPVIDGEADYTRPQKTMQAAEDLGRSESNKPKKVLRARKDE